MKRHGKKNMLVQVMLRVIFLPLIFAALLAVTGLIVVNVMFDPRDLEAVAVDQLQSFFKRPVQIDSARLSLTGEIKIKGLRVTEPGPEAMHFITADYILATYRLAPLLKRSIVLDSVALIAPKIELIRHSSGTWNFSDILAAYRKPSGGRNRLNRIDSAEIRDGVVHLRYLTEKTEYSFENVSFNLKDFKPDEETPFDLSVFFRRNTLGGDLEGRVYAEGLLNLSDFQLDLAEVKNLSLTCSALGKSFKAEGSIKNFRRPEIRLAGRTERLTSGDLAPLFRSRYAFSLPPADWTLLARAGERRTLGLSLRLAQPGLAAEGRIKFSTGVPAAYEFTVFTPPMSLADLRKLMPDLPLSNASGLMQTRLTVNNKTGRPAVSKLVLTSGGVNFQYKNLRFDRLGLSALISDSFKNNYINIRDGQLTMPGFRLTGLNASTRLERGKFAGSYSAQWDDSAMKGAITILEPLTDRKMAEFTGYSRRLDIKQGRDFFMELKKARTPDGRRKSYDADLAWVRTVKNSIPSGFASFRLLYKADFLKHEYFDAKDFYIKADLADIKGQVEKLKGTIAIKSGSGTFYNVQKTSEEDRIYYIFSLPVLTMYRLNRMGALKFGYKLNDVVFNSVGGEYSVDSGKINIRSFYLAGRDFSIYTTGSLDLANENIYLKVYTISDKYYSMGSLPETMTDSSGKPALVFIIEGRMSKPDIKMLSPKEAGSVIREAIRKGVEIDSARIDRFKENK